MHSKQSWETRETYRRPGRQICIVLSVIGEPFELSSYVAFETLNSCNRLY